MDRRWAGVVLLVVALAAAIVMPDLNGRHIPGQAVPAPPPPPPQVGDCVTQPFADVGATGPGDAAYARLPTQPCSGTRFGEVEAVLTPPPDGGRQGTLADPSWAACVAGINSYLELPASSAQGLAFGHWRPSLVVNAPLVIRPSIRQSAAGQHWLACVLAPVRRSDAALPYDVSLHDWLARGSRNFSGQTCRASPAETGDQIVDCTEPHRTELIGSSIGPADFAELQTSCRRLVAALTSMPTATQRQIRIIVQIGDGGGEGPPRGGRLTQNQVGYCVIEAPADRQLTASLIGLHDGPLPWA